MTRELQPCGTPAAYQRHRRHHEPVDDACHEAWKKDNRVRQRELYARPASVSARAARRRPYRLLPAEVTGLAVVGAVDRCGLSVVEAAELLGLSVRRCRAFLALGRRELNGCAS